MNITLTILLYVVAVILYLAALLVARQRLAQESPHKSPNSTGLWCLGLGVLVHATSLTLEFTQIQPIRFGFALALSIMFCGGALLLWVESLKVQIEPLWLMILPLTAVAAALPIFFRGSVLTEQSLRPLFVPHLVVGMLAYSFLALAALHAILMILAERSLHRPAHNPAMSAGSAMIKHAGGPLAWLERLPPLLVLERILFRILAVGFILLSLTLVSGIVFSDEVFGVAWRADHKTLFSLLAWLVFAVLLSGRFFWGWRGRMAARITLGGFCLMLLAYIGSRFVLEVILGRV
jgi:ABC-type uncharacterized transport system permease subunit